MILFLDPVGGIAGDMFLAAMIDLGVISAEELARELAPLGPLGFRIEARRVEKGTAATHVDVIVEGAQPHERSWRDIRALLEKAPLAPGVREKALRIFERVAQAEARAHAKPVDEIHFHEVGAVDSIVDVVGAAVCVERLAPERILAAPPPAGGGVTQSMHGPIPVPAPATVEILRGRSMRASGPGERTTPTGAAILAALSEEVPAMPSMTIERVGYGAGTRDWDDAPNVLRAVLGRLAPQTGELWVLEANLDDATPEVLAFALERLFEAGALDAWLTPALMKKGRPGQILGALCADPARLAVEKAFFAETTTLGVRRHRVERAALDRAHVTVETAYGAVRVKVGSREGAPVNAAPEYEDCARLAREKGVALKEVMAAAIAAYRS